VSLAAQFLLKPFQFLFAFPERSSADIVLLCCMQIFIAVALFGLGLSAAAAGSFPAHAFSPFYFALDWLFRSPRQIEEDENDAATVVPRLYIHSC